MLIPGLLVTVIAMGVMYLTLLAAQDLTRKIATVDSPAAAAAYEMEINVGEVGLKVLKYLNLVDPLVRADVRTDMEEFDRAQQQYAKMTGTDKDRNLAEQAHSLFADFRVLGLRLMDTADARLTLVTRITRALQQLDDIIDEELIPSINPASTSATKKSSAARGLEVNAAEVGAGLGYYTWEATSAHRALVFGNADDFDKDLESLLGLPLSPHERVLAVKARTHWHGIRAQLNRVVKLKDTTDRDLARFMKVRVALDDLLDEGIQAHSLGALTAAQRNAAAAQSKALAWLISLGSIAVVLLLVSAVWLTRLVRRPVRELVQAAAEFGRGNLDHRLPDLGDRELDQVTHGFNRMAGALQETMVSRERLRESEEKHRDILTNIEEGYYEVDMAGNLTFVNPALGRILGYSQEELLGADYRGFTDEHSAKKLFQAFRRVRRTGEPEHDIELEGVLREDGTRNVVSASAQLILDQHGAPVGFRGLQRDTTERKRAERALEHQALHDALTDLPNRTLLADRLAQAMLGAARGDTCALLFLDLDNFKEINDTLGHAAGDELLKQIAPRLRGCMRAGDTLARLGGDEFAIVLPGAQKEHAERVARSIQRAFAAPFELDGLATQVGASVGIAVCPLHSQDDKELMRYADVAMYAAKQDRGGHALYSPERDMHDIERLTLSGELGRAIKHDELALYYQPQLRLRDRTLVGMEALVRWQHPSRGLILPASFIPQAERQGLIRELTLWAIQSAARQSSEWCRSLGLEIPIAVNLSPMLLRDPAFIAETVALLDGGGSGAWLELEVLENALMENPALVLERLKPLRARGVRFSIDDFGTGYSSFAYLHKFQADALKIDQSFIGDVATNENSAMIVGAIIQLAHNLGLEVVAEGVENQETCDRLREFNCDTAQGYHFGRPMPSADCLPWVNALRAAGNTT